MAQTFESTVLLPTHNGSGTEPQPITAFVAIMRKNHANVFFKLEPTLFLGFELEDGNSMYL
jgi:hypothetical protein